ncbi:MAG: hypothetical protein HY394_04490 [Candidatus Diapherotrites archaeon]|nr:hypothetical protein [Candidatus Diapherotrites archaeon]
MQGLQGVQGEPGPQGLQGERGEQGKAAENPARQFSGSHYVGTQHGLTMSPRDARAYNALRAQRERIAQRGPRSYAPKHMSAFRRALAGVDARMNGIRGRYVDLPGTVRAAPSGPGFGRRLARGTGRAITGAVRTAGRTVLTPRVSAVRGRQAIVKGLWGKKKPIRMQRRVP